jgi:putative ABC transport system substrate-binding protein
MDRRTFLAGTAALLAAPLAAQAQPSGKVRRVGYLASGSAVSVPHFFNAFKEGLRETGWIEGQNVTIESRYAEGKLDRFPALAAELVLLKVDVIATVTTPASVAAKNATSVVPIVMMNVAQPVELGLIASLARPGGNVTGITWPDLEIFGKEIALLKEVVPSVRLVAILSNPTNPAHGFAIKKIKAAAEQLECSFNSWRQASSNSLTARSPRWPRSVSMPFSSSRTDCSASSENEWPSSRQNTGCRPPTGSVKAWRPAA